jgi:hypothetical protein
MVTTFHFSMAAARTPLQKAALLLFVEELLEDEECFSPTLLVSLCVNSWPNRYGYLPSLHVSGLLKGGLNHFAEHADSQSFEKITRLDRGCFDHLYSKFEPFWTTKSLRGDFGKDIYPRLDSRSFTGRGCLVLVLHWISHVNDLSGLALMQGTCEATISNYVRWGVIILSQALDNIPEATLQPSIEHLVTLGEQAGQIYGEVMKGCCIITDGSLHPLEHDAAAQWAYLDYDHDHIDYNGWKCCYCKKGLYFFALDGSIVWYSIDCPGKWHDGQIFDRAASFLAGLPTGLWILGDSAFPRIQGRVCRSRKKNEHLPEDPDYARWQLALEAFCGKMRISSEWGIKELKNVWRRFRLPLPSDDKVFRIATWKLMMQLHNYRGRTMHIGQMRTVFLNDKFFTD